MIQVRFVNPFRPGAGHRPPYLAGRAAETAELERLLRQDVILENLVLTGLRGVGKTVLLDTWKPIAMRQGWRWVGADLSEASSVSEETIALRLITDLAVSTSSFVVGERERPFIGFRPPEAREEIRLDFETLRSVYQVTPGLASDKLRQVLELVWSVLRRTSDHGLVFAYDEAQNLADRAGSDSYPLSLLLDVFQSIQKKEIPFMLLLAGLPPLFPQLVEARTFAERMFRVVFLDRLAPQESRDAIQKPIEDARCPVRLDDDSITQIVAASGGYPYMIQFICREAYDAFLQGQTKVPFDEIARKLDTDFFAGRWARATDRQRELMTVAASLASAGSGFTVQQVSERSRELLGRPFSASQVSQMFAALAKAGLVCKDRHGHYSFAVPLLHQFIRRRQQGSGA